MIFRLLSVAILLAVLPGTVLGSIAPGLPTMKERPNIILIALDTLRRDHLGCYGYARKTSPNIDQLAAEGVLFENCYSPASWTLPSFISLFTGLMPTAHGVIRGNDKLSPSIPTLPERLKKKGYFCAGIVSNPFLAGKYGFSRGFDIYDDYSIFLGAELGVFRVDYDDPLGAVNNVVTSKNVTHQAKQLLKKCVASNKPFFMFVLYFDPHDSYIPPAPYNKRYDPIYQGDMDGRNVPRLRKTPPKPRDLEHLIARYDGEIAYTDMQVGQLLKVIDKTCDPKKTIIILIGDHGEAFGEHKMMLHGNSAFREEVIVPMIWRWKGTLPKGQRGKTPALTLDILKSISELLQLKNVTLNQGQSLWPYLLGKMNPPARHVLSEKACIGQTSEYHIVISSKTHRFHVWYTKSITDKDRKLALYNIATDPWEKNNLKEKQPALVHKMLKMLMKKHRESEEISAYYRNRSHKKQVDMSEDERRRLKTMGYINTGGK